MSQNIKTDILFPILRDIHINIGVRLYIDLYDPIIIVKDIEVDVFKEKVLVFARISLDPLDLAQETP